MQLAEVFDPRRLAEGLRVEGRFRRGVAVYAVATLALVGSSLLFEVLKVHISFMMPTLSSIEPPGSSIRDIAFARVGYLVIGTLVVLGVLRISLYVAGLRGKPTTPFMSAFFHSFAFMALASLILLPPVLSAPEMNVNIVSIELGEVKMENASLVGYLSNSTPLRLDARILRAEALRGEMLFENGSRPSWGSLQGAPPSGLVERIELRGAGARVGEEVLQLGDVVAESLTWDSITFRRYGDVVLYPPGGLNPLASLLTVASWIWVIGYTLVATGRLYGIGGRSLAASGAATFLALLVFGLI